MGSTKSIDILLLRTCAAVNKKCCEFFGGSIVANVALQSVSFLKYQSHKSVSVNLKKYQHPCSVQFT